ncbi:pentatricopeptide repeat-containing protein At2g41720 isoform X2 [Cynara cardunculus var. scolymus]|uniref:pentatricopeptide repeat-containing protein At2g41720 isoform X2 n=1 Tax=Cynara cardunculus var. scolymus TaxID=59895 RepID=UPI000D629F34|nr:pentatricopeptide repeat-containing protein At2g41720 isoform X2 [Cynara cardunculus var. scolymus]
MEASLQLYSPLFTPIYPHINSLSLPFHHKPRRKSLPLLPRCCSSEATSKKLVGFVDYDRGERQVSLHVSGFRKSDLSKRNRLRVQGDRFQKDWAISDLVFKILKLNQGEDIDGLLNRWAGRFARKNYPVLIKEISRTGSIEHSNQVFKWMKNQKNYCACNDIYNMMIRLHARHNQTDQARGLFFEMQKWRCKPDAETYNALISAHGRSGQWRWATNIMEDMLRAAVPPTRSTYNNLIHACGSSGNWREALKVSKRMTENGVGPDLVTHNIVLSAFKTGSQYSKALSYFELMKGTKIRPDTTTLNIVIHCLVKLGQFDKAIDIFHSMREKRAQCNPDIVTFTSIIHLYSVYGQIDNCKAVFDTMIAEGLKPNIISYNALLGAYASRGMSEEALSVFNDIKRTGYRPDVVSYTSLLNAYGRSQQPEKAMEVFNMMKKNNRKPNLVTYNALIDAFGSNGLLPEAVDMLHEMERNGVQPNIVSVSTLLACCGRYGQKVKIDSILAAADSRGIYLNTVAYNSAIGSYMNNGEYDKALALYRSMWEKKMLALKIPLSNEVYSSAISVYSKQGQLSKAESLFSTMKMTDGGPDVITYTTMLHAYSAAEKWDNAFALFQEMKMNGVEPDLIACSALMRAFNKGNQPAKVLVIAEFMLERKILMNDAIYFEMLSACSILRDWRKTIELIGVMEPSFNVMSIGLLNQLLHSIGKLGKTETMMKIFYKIVATGAEINNSTYTVLLKNLLAAGNWRKYLEVMQWMEDSGVQPSVEMYQSILAFAQSSGREYSVIIQDRVVSSKISMWDEPHPRPSLTLSSFEMEVRSEFHPIPHRVLEKKNMNISRNR